MTSGPVQGNNTLSSCQKTRGKKWAQMFSHNWSTKQIEPIYTLFLATLSAESAHYFQDIYAVSVHWVDFSGQKDFMRITLWFKVAFVVFS